uniref:Alpha-N-acetylglucosaminidase C-terminal domain-containing protein n=1 Tax=Timema cristinae TaxID=61476 RepID=A0A7R9GV35_TIMCR|nr:unnamed protein product [Timema cristinae]
MQLNLLVYFQGRMLVLDLQSEQYEQYTTYSSYFGQPFIWCMLHNFGGTLGLFGSMSIINQAWFNVSDVVSAWYHLLAASPHLERVPTFQHDLVDVTRQVLQNLGTSLYVIIVDAYRSKNISSFQNNAALMLDLLADLDNVLSSNRAFLLGTWLEAAKALATTPLVRHQCSDK